MLITTKRLTFATPVLIGGKMWETISEQLSPHLTAVIDTLGKDILLKDSKTKTAIVSTTANCVRYVPQGILKETSFEKLLKDAIKINAASDKERAGLVTGIPQR
jgi:hypothetical protein